MLNGLDLFSGVGGITLSLSEWVRPVAYCEADRHAQSVLLTRMRTGDLPTAPIWDDVRTLERKHIFKPIDIIYGGFPCQDLSAAGLGRGLAGERSGLYFQIERLISETNPHYVFLENVPAIRTRGLNTVVQSLTELGYDTRWTVVSAAEVGAPHLRRRWFLLAHANGERGSFINEPRANVEFDLREFAQFCDRERKTGSEMAPVADSMRVRSQKWSRENGETHERSRGQTGDESGLDAARGCEDVAYPDSERGGKRWPWTLLRQRCANAIGQCSPVGADWWITEPDVGRVAHGVPLRVDRLRGLGNAVVPAQAREAFKRLMGL